MLPLHAQEISHSPNANLEHRASAHRSGERADAVQIWSNPGSFEGSRTHRILRHGLPTQPFEASYDANIHPNRKEVRMRHPRARGGRLRFPTGEPPAQRAAH